MMVTLLYHDSSRTIIELNVFFSFLQWVGVFFRVETHRTDTAVGLPRQTIFTHSSQVVLERVNNTCTGGIHSPNKCEWLEVTESARAYSYYVD